MMRLSLITLLGTTAVLFAFIGNARAQENFPLGPENYESDAQPFAPFNLDLDNMAEAQQGGYFFEYNKLIWNYTGERTTVGSSNVSETIQWFNGVNTLNITATNGVFAEAIYRVNQNTNANDIVNVNDPVPAPTVIHNAIQNAGPRAGFALGNRYQFGFRDAGNGWKVEVLDGPEQNQRQFFGFAPRADGGIPPFKDADYTGPSDIGPDNGENANPGTRSFGFGSVPVIFETAPGFMRGFRDYMNNFSDALIGTQAGPYAYVGNYGRVQDPGALPIPFLHIADDINGNGIDAADTIIVIGPDGIPRIGFIHDFDDLFKFNIYFDSVTVRSRTSTSGVEIMSTHELTNQHYMAKHQNNHVSLSWGARFLRLQDEFDVDAAGSIIGDSIWDTTFSNNIVGPQVGVQWVNERQRWRIQTDARFMAGYNIANWEQSGLMGANSIPGALNRLLYMRPTVLNKGLQEQEFAPVGELRVAASYHITSGFALNVGYTGSAIAGVKRAASSVKYALPEMGYVDNGTQTLLSNGIDFGVEFVH
jgi:hypothetical protein